MVLKLLKNYNQEDYLLISGIQHFMFCKHQWGLIHLEDIWQENVLTYEGHLIHQRVDNPLIKERRKNTFYSRSVPVVSHQLKIQGVIDIIEFNKDKKGIFIPDKKDYYIPIIIEYKRGKPKEGEEDKVQLCALAMAFEEMSQCHLDYGYIYYFQTNRREKVILNNTLRDLVRELIKEMYYYFKNKITPKPHKIKSCKNCSLTNICSKNFGNKNAKKYIDDVLAGME